MKNSPLTMVLLGALVVSILTSVVLCYFYTTRARELHNLQFQMQGEIVGIQNNRAFLGALASDLLEYSKTHHDIDPLLEPFKPAKPAGPAPATRPASK